jgi:glycosyltransferase involved in cell wall biosynthesis
MILYSYQAYHYDIIKQATMVALVYDVLDDPSIHNSASYNEKHQKMLERADIIITSSELLYQQYKQSFLEKRVSYIPNAVHMPDFSLQPNTPKPKDFPCYASYTIGYFGAIAEWFDYDLLDLVCKRNLDKQIVLIGPCREGFLETELIQALVKSNCNLFYLGVKPHQELALYGKYFDVALIPFIDNDITRHCSPVKLFEYMALGLPIVTTNIPECRKYTSALVAQDREEFLLQIEKAGKIPKESMYFQTMRQEAEANTWDARAQAVMKVVHETLASM